MRVARFVFATCLLPVVSPAQDIAQLARTGQQAVSAGAYTTAVYFLKQVVAAEPKHALAWKDLCRAYLELDQVNAAMDACVKQIEVDPDNSEVYGTLGRALWRQGKREEAVEEFQKQTELDPGNGVARARLGRLYGELGRYAEAVPELETAVTMNPANIEAQADLGGAYMAVGQTDKGFAILKKLAEDHSEAAVLDWVAYQLASHQVRLDLAEKYAHLAVTGAAANADEPISAATLSRVVRLAACWDTLGWVHLQRCNLDEAHKFITAAWSVNPDGPIGDHLGQLYERRGQKQQAIETYAKALASRSALAETRRRLEALLSPGEAAPKIDPHMGSIPAGKLVPDRAAAQYEVIQVQVPGVPFAKFLRGDEQLRPFTKTAQALTPPGTFPETLPTKVARLVTLTCPGQGGECWIELLPATAAVFAELNSTPPDTHFASEPLPGKPGIYRVGGGVTPPVPTYRPEPQYSKEALKKKLQGTVILYIEVDSTGHPRHIRVVRGLGHGLDEKAIEAVSHWEFRPGMKDGKLVTVAATVEVNFRLLNDH